MGLFDYFRATSNLPQALRTSKHAIASPLAPRPNHLESVVWSDLLDREYGEITRADAMTIPSVVRGRGLICTTIARAALTVTDRDGNELDPQPIWLRRTDSLTTPFHRLLWTADDLLFYGVSLWIAKRDYDNKIIACERVPLDRWSVTSEGIITIDDRECSADEVIAFEGIHEGILSFGRETISQARGLLRSAERAATQPAAMIELHQTNQRPITDAEVDHTIARWQAARRGANGGVAFTSNAIETKELGSAKEHLLVQGRAASAIDIARLLGIPAPMIDAAQEGSSLSYSNTASRLNELIAFGIAPLMAAISARLSQDDVLPAGQKIDFDTSNIVAAVNNEIWNDEKSKDYERLQSRSEYIDDRR